MTETRAPDDLAALADAHGVATTYGNWRHEPQQVPPPTVRAALAAMDVAAGTDEEVRESLRAAVEAPWRRLVPPTVVLRRGGRTTVTVTAAEGALADATVTADGVEHRLTLAGAEGPARSVDGVSRVRHHAALPPEVGVGTHRLTVRSGAEEDVATLLVAPERCPVPATRSWGWQVQLYALRSAASWGMGDFGDLRTLVERSGREHGAGLVLLNPLHAALPVLPQEPSPYSPASRRFVNPLYLRVEECDGYAALGAGDRARVGAGATAAWGTEPDRIDRDAVFRAKGAAFEVLARQPLPPARAAAFAAYREAEGRGLVDFATACALAERHGRSWTGWPAALQDPDGAAVAAARRDLARRVELHTWLQWQCDVQLGVAAATAAAAGMPVGLVTDLAVGVDPGGADAWALQADLARAVTVGAPPDSFNQQGQDWRLPPLRPDRLPATGYAPFRDLVRSGLRHAGGLRIDHAMGLFRLFWIPDGAAPADGTYVRYPAEDLLGVLALEAHVAGAVVVGEDLGTVERGVPETLRSRGLLGSRVLWFERTAPGGSGAGDDGADDTEPLPSAGYPELALTSISTHDLPTAAGYLVDEPAYVRGRLGQLGHDLAVELEQAERARSELVALLVREGLAAPDADTAALVEAMHAFVARTPSLLVTASPADAVGDLRQPNLPGTTDEYPNWRLPVARPTGGSEDAAGRREGLLPASRPLSLEELLDAPEVARLARVLAEGRRGG